MVVITADIYVLGMKLLRDLASLVYSVNIPALR